jgi:hypothetical protein
MGREGDHSPPSSAEVKNGGAIPPLPPGNVPLRFALLCLRCLQVDGSFRLFTWFTCYNGESINAALRGHNVIDRNFGTVQGFL